VKSPSSSYHLDGSHLYTPVKSPSSSYHLDGSHLYTPLPVAYLPEFGGVTSLDSEGEDAELRGGAVRVTYTSSGCCVSPVKDSDGVHLDQHDYAAAAAAAGNTMSRLLCCRQRTQVGYYTVFHNKKLSYRRGTARCVVSVEILPIATQQCRNYLYNKS